MEKSLYKEAMTVLRKGKRLAKKYEQHLLLIELNQEEKKIIAKDLNIRSFEKILDIRDQEEKELQFHITEDTYYNLYLKLHTILSRARFARSKDQEQQIDELFRDPLLKRKEPPDTFLSKFYHYRIYALYHFARDEYQKMEWYTRRQLELVYAHPGQIEKNPMIYVEILNYWLTVLRRLERFDELPHAIQQMKEAPFKFLKNKNPQVNTHAFLISSVFETDMYIETGNFENGLRLIPVISRKLEEINMDDIQTERLLVLYFNLAYLYFGACQYGKALYWLNKLLNDSHIYIRENLQVTSRIFNMIIHYELENYDMLEYQVRSTYRFLIQKKQLYRYEILLLEFIRKRLPKIPGKKELAEKQFYTGTHITTLTQTEL